MDEFARRRGDERLVCRRRRAVPNGDPALQAVAHIARCRAEVADTSDNAASLLDKGSTILCDFCIASLAFEQLYAQTILKLLDSSAKRNLLHVECRCSQGKSLRASGGYCIAKLAQLDRRAP